MEKHDKSNPIASVDALINAKPLTIAQVALLSRIDSPILFGIADDINKCITALYLLSIPMSEAVKHLKTAEDDALVWSHEKYGSFKDYSRDMCSLLDSITEFWKMMPSADPKKKQFDTATDGSLN